MSENAVFLNPIETQAIYDQLSKENLNDDIPFKIVLPEGEFLIDDIDARRFLIETERITGGPIVPLIFKAFCSCSNATGEVPIQASNINKIIESNEGSLDDKEKERLATLLNQASKLDILDDLQRAVLNMDHKRVTYPILKGTLSIITRNVNRRDFLSLIKTLVVLDDYKTLISRLNKSKLLQLAPNVVKLTDIKENIINGKIKVLCDPNGVLEGAIGTYNMQTNTLCYPEEKKGDVFGFEEKQGALSDAQVVIHELVHAVQDKEKRVLWKNDAEAEAHAVEMLYCLLKYGTERTRAHYTDEIEMNEEEFAAGWRDMANIYGEELVEHSKKLFLASGVRKAAIDWSISLLSSLSDKKGQLKELSVHKIATTYATAHVISILWNTMSAAGMQMLASNLNSGRPFTFDALGVSWVDGNPKVDQATITLPDHLKILYDYIRTFTKDNIIKYQKKLVDDHDQKMMQGLKIFLGNIPARALAYVAYSMKYDPSFDTIKFFDNELLPIMTISEFNGTVPTESFGL